VPSVIATKSVCVRERHMASIWRVWPKCKSRKCRTAEISAFLANSNICGYSTSRIGKPRQKAQTQTKSNKQKLTN